MNSAEGRTKFTFPTLNFPMVKPKSFLSLVKTGPPLNPRRTLQVVINILTGTLTTYPKTVEGMFSLQPYPIANTFWPVNNFNVIGVT